MARCDNCGKVFTNAYQLGPHKVFCWNRQLPLEDEFSDSSEQNADSVRDVSNRDDSADDGDVEIKLTDLAQRPRADCWGEIHRIALSNRPVFIDTCATYNYESLQRRFRTYVSDVMELCTPQFWQMFETVMHQSSAVADLVLSTACKLLSDHTVKLKLGHRWPRSTRSLRSRMRNQLGSFWDNVQETYSIDVKRFGLPGIHAVSFTFVDPIYIWIQQCEDLHRDGHEFHWDAKILSHPDTHECAYGAGIQYGMLLRSACSNTPAGARVALMNLSWDAGDTGYKTRSACPICIQVMNVNSGSTKTIGLVGYLPHVEIGDAYAQHKNYVLCQQYILQVGCGHFVTFIIRIYLYFIFLFL